jgi:hypothetical protein
VPNVVGGDGVTVDVPEDRFKEHSDADWKPIQFAKARFLESGEVRHPIRRPTELELTNSVKWVRV